MQGIIIIYDYSLQAYWYDILRQIPKHGIASEGNSKRREVSCQAN